jgi:putative transposase
LYNAALQQRSIVDYHEQKINYYTQTKELPAIKLDFPFFKDVPAQVLQQTLKNLDTAFVKFFKGEADYPKPKKKFKREAGLRFPDPKQFEITENASKKKGYVELPKIGRLKFRKSRKIVGKVKSCTITKGGYGVYYISFLCEYEVDEPIAPLGEIGIDRGIVHTLATSNGDFYDLPKKIKHIEKLIAYYQRLLALKVKFSSNWKKLKRKISKLYSKVANIRQDFLWKAARAIAKNHGFIVLEDLRTKNMSKSASGTVEKLGKKVAQKSGLNRSILRQGWYMFQTMLTQKAIEFGGILVLVDPKNTSRECSRCGWVDKDNRVDQSHFECQKCRLKINADINAALVILARGIRVIALRVA